MFLITASRRHFARSQEFLVAMRAVAHRAACPLRLTNVCFGGRKGRGADLSDCPLMTQSGHTRS